MPAPYGVTIPLGPLPAILRVGLGHLWDELVRTKGMITQAIGLEWPNIVFINPPRLNMGKAP